MFMQSNIKKRIGYAVSLISLLVIFGCATIQKDYELAQKQDTIEGWKRFVGKHPQSEYSSLAKNRIVELEDAKRKQLEEKERGAWEQAQQINTMDSYWKFLEDYREGNYASSANAAFKKAVEKKIDELVKGNYSLIFPGSQFPLNQFSSIEIINAMGDVYRGGSRQRVVDTKTKKVMKQNISSSYRMLSLSCGTQNARLCFINTRNKNFIFSIRAQENMGEITENKLIIGNGYAILNENNMIKVYKW